MGQVSCHTVNGVAGSEYGFPPGLHIGIGMGIISMLPVLVHHILCQVFVRFNLIVSSIPDGQVMRSPVKDFGL